MTPRRTATPTEDSALQLAELLSSASRRLRRGAMAQLTPLGLTFAQARGLRVLAEAEGPLRMADVAARLDVVPRSATSMIDTLEAAGLVARAPDPGDRRSVLVTLTGTGHDLLARLQRARRASADELFGPLDAAERAELQRLLGALCNRQACAPGATRQGGAA